MYEASMTRLVVYALVGTVLSAASIDIYSEWFWCILGLFICSDYLGRRAGFELGVTQGMTVYSQATDEQRAAIDKIIKDTAND
jgi:hypothetical protein